MSRGILYGRYHLPDLDHPFSPADSGFHSSPMTLRSSSALALIPSPLDNPAVTFVKSNLTLACLDGMQNAPRSAPGLRKHPTFGEGGGGIGVYLPRSARHNRGGVRECALIVARRWGLARVACTFGITRPPRSLQPRKCSAPPPKVVPPPGHPPTSTTKGPQNHAIHRTIKCSSESACLPGGRLGKGVKSRG